MVKEGEDEEDQSRPKSLKADQKADHSSCLEGTTSSIDFQEIEPVLQVGCSASLGATCQLSLTVDGKEEVGAEMVDEMAAGIAVVAVLAAVFLHLIVVNWSGDEVAQLEVEPSDTVMVGLRQIEEQIGVAVSRQRLVCGEDALEPVEMWSSYSNVRDWATIQLTVLQFDAASDREALMAIFDNCGGVGWVFKENWGSGEPLSSWKGVVDVDENGRVSNFQKSYDERVSGAIPPEIGHLTSLSRLILTLLNLTGVIPNSLGHLTNLCHLVLGRNQLTGVIPPELSQLTGLRILSLGNNQLSGVIPPGFGTLTALVNLDLGNNQLTGEIPRELGNLTRLDTLIVGNNQLTGKIPRVLKELTRLTHIDLSGNFLTSLLPLQEMTVKAKTQDFLKRISESI